jgi:hypothetical protein
MLFRCQLLPGSRVLPLHVTVTLNQFAKLGFIYSSIATKSCTGVNACRGVPYRWGMGRKPLESPEAPCLQDGMSAQHRAEAAGPFHPAYVEVLAAVVITGARNLRARASHVEAGATCRANRAYRKQLPLTCMRFSSV